MITLDKIVNSNLEMLKSQEAELLKSLSFVQKAKQLFEAHWGENGITRGRKPGRPAGKKATPKVGRASGRKTRKAYSKVRGKRVSHLTNIIDTLKNHKNPMSSGELIESLFKKQKANKDIKRFRLLIYPVLTKAYATKALQRKNGKIHLPK
jgi:hypothetical protein